MGTLKWSLNETNFRLFFSNFARAAQAKQVSRSPVLQPVRSFHETEVVMMYNKCHFSKRAGIIFEEKDMKGPFFSDLEARCNTVNCIELQTIQRTEKSIDDHGFSPDFFLRRKISPTL